MLAWKIEGAASCGNYTAGLQAGQGLGSVGGHGWYGAEQLLCVRVLRAGKDLSYGACFEDLALAHDGDSRGYLADDGEIVAGEENGEAALALKTGEKRKDLCLNGDVERGGWLVGEQQLRLVNERHGDENALTLAAGELVRVVSQA